MAPRQLPGPRDTHTMCQTAPTNSLRTQTVKAALEKLLESCGHTVARGQGTERGAVLRVSSACRHRGVPGRARGGATATDWTLEALECTPPPPPSRFSPETHGGRAPRGQVTAPVRSHGTAAPLRLTVLYKCREILETGVCGHPAVTQVHRRHGPHPLCTLCLCPVWCFSLRPHLSW